MAKFDINDVFGGDSLLEGDATKTKILDAALAEAAAQGIDRLTLEGVARRGKLNRATIYRQFGGKDTLLSALALREAQKLVAELSQAALNFDHPKDVILEGFVAALSFARQHPVISRLVVYEPGAIVEYANANDAAVLKLGTTVMATTVAWAQTLGFAKHLQAEDAGDILARLFSSYVIFPNGHNQLDDDSAARAFAERVLIPMLNGPESHHS